MFVFHSVRKWLTGHVVFFLLPILVLASAGLSVITVFSWSDFAFWKQFIAICVAVVVLVGSSRLDYRFMRDTKVILFMYTLVIVILTVLFIVGHVAKGAQSWFEFGGFAFQPIDIAKLTIIALLAKYFSKRHAEIARFRHLVASFLWVLVPALLVLAQPDLGGTLVILGIWVGMIAVSGIRLQHIILILLITIAASVGAWHFTLKQYQKDRILNTIDPMRDPRGSGYNVIQSLVAIGSGGLTGKGVGYGTQSRLQYLPEYKTDFVYAAFVEEWGLLGSLILLMCYVLIIYKIGSFATVAETNFEALFMYGVMSWLVVHIAVNIGMNLGVAPVTGIPLPFMSGGGSHMVTECLAIGMVLGMHSYSRATHKNNMRNEFFGSI